MIDNTKQLSKKMLNTSLGKWQSFQLCTNLMLMDFFTETQNYKNPLMNLILYQVSLPVFMLF